MAATKTKATEEIDNRLARPICLCDDFVEKHLPERSHIPFLLLVALRFYVCIIDGECGVERDPGPLLMAGDFQNLPGSVRT